MKPIPDVLLEAFARDLLWFDVKLEDIRSAWNNARADDAASEILADRSGGFMSRDWFIDGATKALTEYVGEHCPDYNPDCPTCKAWTEFGGYLQE